MGFFLGGERALNKVGLQNFVTARSNLARVSSYTGLNSQLPHQLVRTQLQTSYRMSYSANSFEHELRTSYSVQLFNILFPVCFDPVNVVISKTS